VKALFFLAVILGGVWFLRRLMAHPSAVGQKRATEVPSELVRCHHCGVHLLASDAVIGDQGHYCSETHLHESEG